METHYDNPDYRSDFVDNSGIRIFLTRQLRQEDAGILEAGVNVDYFQEIPPNNPAFLSTGHCHPTCMSQGLGSQEITVFANMLHAHLIGSKLRTRHFRGGKELEPIAVDNNYDFDFQESRYLTTPRKVKPGDYIRVECVYDSTSRSDMTNGGLSSREEMCLSFIYYYPRVPLTKCLTRLQYKDLQHTSADRLLHTISHWDWSKQATQDRFRHVVDEAWVAHKCHVDQGHVDFNGAITEAPAATPYNETTSTC